MKKVYIVLTYTGTVLAKVIKYYTHAEYSHISIALDENLEEMYSFGRIYSYIPFYGGYVHERLDKGTYKRFKNTDASIYTLDVTDEQYEIIEKLVHDMYDNRYKYRFNVIGLFANGLNIKFMERRNYFYCVEFIKYVFKKANIDIKLPKLARPNDFKKLKELSLEYKGKLRFYKTGEVC
jgi:hypothetical protein